MIVKAIPFKQGSSTLYIFSASAKALWSVVEINKRSDDKVDGYQRTLSESRALDIKKFITQGNVIAPAIVIALDQNEVSFNEATGDLTINDVTNAGWVIDGQHRLRGAELAEINDFGVELAVVAFIGLDLQHQIQQFVTINKEAKGVPTSLYYDLIKFFPREKKPAEIAKEIAAAIADQLRKDSKSIFFDRIVVVTSPKKGEISLNNFVRKVAPLLLEGKGALSAYSQKEATQIIENYFCALKSVFPEEFSVHKQRFFQTLGFGAAINALFPIFSITHREKGGFRIVDVEFMLEKANDFLFADWDNMGTGSAAEIQAGKDFEAHFRSKVQDDNGTLLRL